MIRVKELLGLKAEETHAPMGRLVTPGVAPAQKRAEQGPAPPPEIRPVAPEITDEMLEQIAARVADRLSAATMPETVRKVVTETSERLIRDTVTAVLVETSERIVRENMRGVVLETSERLVREEIERIKSGARTQLETGKP